MRKEEGIGMKEGNREGKGIGKEGTKERLNAQSCPLCRQTCRWRQAASIKVSQGSVEGGSGCAWINRLTLARMGRDDSRDVVMVEEVAAETEGRGGELRRVGCGWARRDSSVVW